MVLTVVDESANVSPFTVFVSHTSRTRADTELAPPPDDTPGRHRARKRYLLDHLVPALEKSLESRGVEMWIDLRRIAASEEFEPAIALALARCHAAVVLVDRDALNSPFMCREASILGFRRLVEPGLQILPVLIGDVTERDFGRSPLGGSGGLASLSCLVSPDRRNRNAAAGAQLAEQIAAALGTPVTGDRRTAQWVADVAHFLQEVPPHALDDVERELGIVEHAVPRAGSRRERIAAALLQSDLEKALPVMRRINDYLLSGTRSQVAKRIMPLWVNIDSAGRLMGVASRAAGSRIVGLETASLVRADHAVQRASAAAPQVLAQRMAGASGEEQVAVLVQRYDEVLRTALALEPDDDPEYVRTELARDGLLVFGLLQCAGLSSRVTGQVVRSLVLRFPGVIFILVGQLDPRSLRFDRITLVNDEGEKRRTRRQIRQLSAMIGEEVSFDDD